MRIAISVHKHENCGMFISSKQMRPLKLAWIPFELNVITNDGLRERVTAMSTHFIFKAQEVMGINTATSLQLPLLMHKCTVAITDNDKGKSFERSDKFGIVCGALRSRGRPIKAPNNVNSRLSLLMIGYKRGFRCLYVLRSCFLSESRES